MKKVLKIIAYACVGVLALFFLLLLALEPVVNTARFKKEIESIFDEDFDLNFKVDQGNLITDALQLSYLGSSTKISGRLNLLRKMPDAKLRIESSGSDFWHKVWRNERLCNCHIWNYLETAGFRSRHTSGRHYYG